MCLLCVTMSQYLMNIICMICSMKTLKDGVEFLDINLVTDFLWEQVYSTVSTFF